MAVKAGLCRAVAAQIAVFALWAFGRLTLAVLDFSFGNLATFTRTARARCFGRVILCKAKACEKLLKVKIEYDVKTVHQVHDLRLLSEIAFIHKENGLHS